MKSHDWIFLMFTTIICCTTIITIAQAQQRGRVKFGVSMQKDEVDTNANPEIVSLANQARGSASHRASSRFRAAIPSAIPLTIEENKEPSRSLQRGTRGRTNDRSSRKLTAEATEAIPLVRSRKRINPVPTASSSVDQPIKIELPTSSVDRTNVIRRSKPRPESAASSTSPPSTSSASIRRRSDVSSEGPSTEGVRKVRTFTSRSVTKQQADEVISSENPLTVATTGSNWRNVALKRGTSKVKSSERKSKALEVDQLEDENYPEHFKLLLRKQQPSAALLPKNYPKMPIQEDQTYSKLNEIYEAPKVQVGRLRRLEQTSQETSDEILQVSRAIPKVRRVELKREDTARAALKTRRIEPRLEENVESALQSEEPPKSRRTDAEKLRAQVKINKAAIKSRKKEPSNEVQREDILKVPSKSNRRSESSTEDNGPEVKPNEIEESSKASSKPLFLPRRAEPYRPKPKTTTQRPTTTSKPIKKPEVLAARTKFKNRFNSRLQFPSLRTKTSSTSDEVIKYDNEVVNTSPAPQPVRPLQITKSRNLALDRPAVDARPKPKQQKFSSRYRGDAFSRYQQKTEPSKPIYTPTIPALTTEPIPPQLDQVIPYNFENNDLNKSGSNFEGIVYDGTAGVWNMVEPVAGGLTRSEISVESVGEEQPLAQSSVTVSIFEALADILSKTPSTTTTSTTTTTTTTSTTTTELPDIIQVPEQKIDSISSTTVNKHDPITDVMDDENTSTTTNEITNNDRDGRLLNSVEINQSTTIFTPTTTLSIDTNDSLETITVPQNTSDTTLLFKSQTEQTTPEFTDLTTLSLSPASTTQPTLINTNLTNISTNLLELTTLASNPPTSLPMPFLADALTTPGSSLITRPQLISAISNFLDTSVQNASDTMATTTENTTETTTTTATLDTNSTPTDASTTLSPPITTTFSPPSTGSPPVTISFLDLFTIQAKKVNQNTEPAVEVHPIYKGPESTTIPVVEEKKQTTGRPVNINTFFGTPTYPSISITGSTSTDRTLELSSTFSGNPKVTGGETTDTPIPSTNTHEQDTSTLDYTTSPQSSIRTQSLPIHLNSILGSTQKYDQTSPFKTVQTEITTTIRSRFGNRRIPILPAGSVQSTTNKISTSTQTSSTTTPVSTTTTTVTQVSPENNQQKQQQLSNVTTTTSSTTTTEQKPIQDFSVYGILPNNTVVRKRPPQLSRQLDIGIMVYGILPNQTVVRKYPNGTLMIVDSSKDVEVVDIDPKMLFNPFSELYRTSQSSLILTTHRSTTSHRLIESNHILSSSSSSSSTEVPNNSATGSGGRRGNSIKETTESGNTDSALSTNTDDENLIQWLSENEDNILNSTILFESNTENAVLLDLLKRKYIKTDLPSRGSNVVSLTTVRNVVEENSIPANREEDVSENTLFDSSEEKKKDPIDDFFLSKGSVIPNRINNNNNDDENVILKQFDTSYANVGIGSIFAGNKGRKLKNSQRTKLYPINYEMAIQNTTTKLFPIHTFTSSTMHKINHAVQKEFLAEVVNRTHGVVVDNSINGFNTATPKRDGESKFIDFGILESEVDSEANRDYFMDPEDRLKIVDDGFDFDTEEGSGNSYSDDVDDSELKGFDNTGEYNTKSGLDKPITDLVDIKTSPILDESLNSTVSVNLSEKKVDSEAFKGDSATKTILSDSENDNIESPFIHIVFPEGVLESSEQFSDIYTTVSPLRNTSLLFKSEDLIPSFNKKEKPKTSQNRNLGDILLSQDSTTLNPNLDKVSEDRDDILHDTVIVSTTTLKPSISGRDERPEIGLSNLPLDIKNVSRHIENSSKSYDKEFSNTFVSEFENGTLSSLDDGNLGLKNESLLQSVGDNYQNGLSSNNETKSEGFFGSDSKISDDLDSTHSYVFDNSSTKNTFSNFASDDTKDLIIQQHSEEVNSESSLHTNNRSESEISSSNNLKNKNQAPQVESSHVRLSQDESFFTSFNGTENISENYFRNKTSVSEESSTVSNDYLSLKDSQTLLSTDNNKNTSSIIAPISDKIVKEIYPQENITETLTSSFEGNSDLNSEIPAEHESSKDNYSPDRELESEISPIRNFESENDKETIVSESNSKSSGKDSFKHSFSPENSSEALKPYFDSKTAGGNITPTDWNIEKDSESPNEVKPYDRKPVTENYVDEMLTFENIQAGIPLVPKDSIIISDIKDLSINSENTNTTKQMQNISSEGVINLNENDSSNDVYSHDINSEVLVNTNAGSKTIEENKDLNQLTISQDSKISFEPDSFKENYTSINFNPEIIQPFNLNNSEKTSLNNEISLVGSPIPHFETISLDQLVKNTEFKNNHTEPLSTTQTKVLESLDGESNSLHGPQSVFDSSEIISSTKEFSTAEILLNNEELSTGNHNENKSEGFSIVHGNFDSQITTVASKSDNSETSDSLSEILNSTVNSDKFQMEKPIIEDSKKTISDEEQVFRTESQMYPERNELNTNINFYTFYDTNENLSPFEKQQQKISENNNINLSENLNSINEQNKTLENITPEINTNVTTDFSVGLPVVENEPNRSPVNVKTVDVSKLDEQNDLKTTEFERDFIKNLNLSSTESPLDLTKNNISTEEFITSNVEINSSNQIDSNRNNHTGIQNLIIDSFVEDLSHQTNIGNVTLIGSKFITLSEELNSTDRSIHPINNIELNRILLASVGEENSSKQVNSSIPYHQVSKNLDMPNGVADNSTDESTFDRNNHALKPTITNVIEALHILKPDQGNEDSMTKIRNDNIYDSKLSDKSPSTENSIGLGPRISNDEENSFNQVDINTFATTSTPFEVTDSNVIHSSSSSDFASDIEVKVSEKLGDEFYLPTTSDNKQNKNETSIDNETLGDKILISKNEITSPNSAVVVEESGKFDSPDYNSIPNEQFSASNTSDSSYKTLNVDQFFTQFEEHEVSSPNPSMNSDSWNQISEPPLTNNSKQFEESKPKNNSSENIYIDKNMTEGGKLQETLPVINIQNRTELLESSKLNSTENPKVNVFFYNFNEQSEKPYSISDFTTQSVRVDEDLNSQKTLDKAMSISNPQENHGKLDSPIISNKTNQFHDSKFSSEKEYPGIVQVEVEQKPKFLDPSADISDQYNSTNSTNEYIDHNVVKNTNILEQSTPSTNQVFENDSNTQEKYSSANDSDGKNKTSSKEIWTSSISSEIVENDGLIESQLPNYSSLANISLQSKQNFSIRNNESETETVGRGLNFNASFSVENENNISNLKSQTIESSITDSKVNGSSYDDKTTGIPALIKSQFDSAFSIGQELTKTQDSLFNKTSEVMTNNDSQPIFLDPIIKTLNTSELTDKDLEINQHVVPRKGALLNLTEELRSTLLENHTPIVLSEIIPSKTNDKIENEDSYKNNERILLSGFSNDTVNSQNFILPNISQKHSEEALHSYNQIKEVDIETSVPQYSSPKPLTIEKYNDYVPTVSTEKERNLFEGINSHVDATEVLPDQHPVTLSKPPTLQNIFAPKIPITSNVQNELGSSVDVGSEYEPQYSTQIPILQSADQILEQKFETSSVRPIPSKADKERVSKIILELLNKSEQNGRKISENTISNTNVVVENSPRNYDDSLVFKKSFLDFSENMETKLNMPENKVSSPISGHQSESKDYEDKRTQQNFISEQPVIDAKNIRTSTNFDEEYSKTESLQPTISSPTTKNIFVVSSIPTAYSLVTASSEEVTKPPKVFYPVNSPKSIIPSPKPFNAAIVTPTKTRAYFESSTEPNRVSMIFPKDFMPTLNMALPGSLHQTYTQESFHKPVLMPSSNDNLHQESTTKPNSNIVKSQKEQQFNVPYKQNNSPSYVQESSSDRTTVLTTQKTKDFVETTTPTLAKDKVQEVPLFIPGGVPTELMSNTDSFKLPTSSSNKPIHKTVENKFVPGGVPRNLLENIRTLPKKNILVGPVFTADTPLGAVFGHFPSNSIVPTHVPSSTTPVPLKTTDNTFHKTYQFNLKMLKSTIEKVENDVKVLKETFIKSLNKSTNLIEPIEEKRNRLESLNNSSKTIQDFLEKSNEGFRSESLTKDNIAPLDQLDLLQETLDPALAIRSISNAPTNLVENKKFNLQTMMKNSEFKPINSNPVYQMSANALANAQTINSIMSESTADSVSKSNAHPIINNDANKSGFNTNSGQNLYKPVTFSETPQQIPSSEMNVDSWTKHTPSEVTYIPVQNIEAHNQIHTETQYTIQQQNMLQESSTLSSLGNSFVIDNLKNSINTIAEPKQVDRQTTPTIYLVTPASMMTTSELPTTTTSSTTPSTTTSTSTTPSSTTTSTTPSTTTTSTTTPSTTTSTTTTTTTTTSTTTTPIPIIPEITTTPKPTIVFKAPSTTSGTILNSQSPSQTNTALNDANNSELEKNIKLLEQLLQLQASLKPKSSSSSTTSTSTPSTTTTTTKATEAPIKTIASSSADDEQFINQLRQLLLSQQQATKKTTTTTTPKPTTTTTSTTTKKPITISPQNLQDLLNSFSTPSFTTTTPKPIPNVNDIEFLNSLREIGKIQVTTSAPTTFANRIIELALKNRPVKPTSPVYISTTVPPFVPMPEVKFPQILPSNEVEKHRQDQASLSADLSLLSTLLGRRITIADLPQITQQFGGNRAKPAPVPAPRKTTTTTTTPRTTRKTTTTTSTERPMTRDEIAEIEKNLNLLSSLLGRPVSLNELPLIMQELRSGRKPKGTASGATINFITPAPFKTTTTSTVRSKPSVSLPSQTPISQEEVIELLKDPTFASPEQLNIYGQSNDAILAAVLKQRGIGPVHNNLPVNDLFGQEQTQKPYRPTRPPPPPPPPQRRPVLDGLAWLWRTWQETAAPGNRVSKNNRQPTASASTRLESPLLVGVLGGGEAPAPTVNSNEGGEYADLQYPQNPSFGQGNGLLTAAFGVTKAVSQFLGAAFQGAAKSVQSAFSPQAIQQPSLISLSG